MEARPFTLVALVLATAWAGCLSDTGTPGAIDHAIESYDQVQEEFHRQSALMLRQLSMSAFDPATAWWVSQR